MHSSYSHVIEHKIVKNMMNDEIPPLLVWCKPEQQTRTTKIQAVRVDTGEEVYLNEDCFLLRITTDANAPMTRCLVRHVASGSEAYLQGGPNLQTFIKTYLLQNSQPTEQHTSDDANPIA